MKGPAVTQFNRFVDIIDTRGWVEASNIFKSLKNAITAYVTGDPITSLEAKE
jgi:hypothetical protein